MASVVGIRVTSVVRIRDETSNGSCEYRDDISGGNRHDISNGGGEDRNDISNGGGVRDAIIGGDIN